MDIGYGRGFRDVFMAEWPSVKSVEGIGYSARSIQTAQARPPPLKETRHVADFPPARRPDLVVSFQVFEHLSDPDAYLRFCSDACTPGGHIATSTVKRFRLTNWLRARKGLRR